MADEHCGDDDVDDIDLVELEEVSSEGALVESEQNAKLRRLAEKLGKWKTLLAFVSTLLIAVLKLVELGQETLAKIHIDTSDPLVALQHLTAVQWPQILVIVLEASAVGAAGWLFVTFSVTYVTTNIGRIGGDVTHIGKIGNDVTKVRANNNKVYKKIAALKRAYDSAKLLKVDDDIRRWIDGLRMAELEIATAALAEKDRELANRDLELENWRNQFKQKSDELAKLDADYRQLVDALNNLPQAEQTVQQLSAIIGRMRGRPPLNEEPSVAQG